MKRILLYTLLCLLFLSLVFVLDGVHFGVQNNMPETFANDIIYESTDSIDEFHSNLPVVIINTNNQRITKDEKVIVEISLLQDFEVNFSSGGIGG